MSKLSFSVAHRRQVLAGGGAALLLSACGNIIGPPEASQLYLLKPTDESFAPGPNVPWSLSIDTPRASDALDTRRIAITRSPTTMDYYANAEWPDQLTDIVRSALVEGFEKSGRIAQVAPDSVGLHADYLLLTDIRDFEARYDQPDGIPTAVVRVEAKLTTARSREILASTVVDKEVAASQNSVDAAVTAFGSALGAAVSDIVSWCLGAAPQQRRD